MKDELAQRRRETKESILYTQDSGFPGNFTEKLARAAIFKFFSPRLRDCVVNGFSHPL
jgi:hypothetical protein